MNALETVSLKRDKQNLQISRVFSVFSSSFCVGAIFLLERHSDFDCDSFILICSRAIINPNSNDNNLKSVYSGDAKDHDPRAPSTLKINVIPTFSLIRCCVCICEGSWGLSLEGHWWSHIFCFSKQTDIPVIFPLLFSKHSSLFREICFVFTIVCLAEH